MCDWDDPELWEPPRPLVKLTAWQPAIPESEQPNEVERALFGQWLRDMVGDTDEA